MYIVYYHKTYPHQYQGDPIAAFDTEEQAKKYVESITPLVYSSQFLDIKEGTSLKMFTDYSLMRYMIRT